MAIGLSRSSSVWKAWDCPCPAKRSSYLLHRAQARASWRLRDAEKMKGLRARAKMSSWTSASRCCPADGSYHVLSPQQVKEVAERIKAKVIVLHHYYIWN